MAELNSYEQVQKFLDISVEYKENTEFFGIDFESSGDMYKYYPKHIKVIGFFHDIDEYKNDYLSLKKAAVGMVDREDMRIAYVLDEDTIEAAKKKMSIKWFDKMSKNSIIIQREHNDYSYIDLESEKNVDYSRWLYK